ncbi:hypothetical protein OH492_20465 [Vibrio chagasii]|nr:hypothetical protein [Vibrio chagasii]
MFLETPKICDADYGTLLALHLCWLRWQRKSTISGGSSSDIIYMVMLATMLFTDKMVTTSCLVGMVGDTLTVNINGSNTLLRWRYGCC